MNKFGLTSITVMLLLCSCATMRRAEPYSPTDIASNPAILHDGSVPRDQMTLRGVRLGDPKSAIFASRIDDPNGKGGWIICTDGSRYRIESDIVATLGLWDVKALSRLNISSPADIEARFGKPEAVEDAGLAFIYRYAGGKVSVIWNKAEAQINAVNVSR